MSKTANVLIENQEISLKLGDEIIVEGSKTYMIEKIKKMIYKGMKIKTITKNDFIYPAKINLRVNTEVKQNDKIFMYVRT